MIVADVNVLAYLLIPGKFTKAAEQLLEEEPVWVVPRLWRSEFRNILANYLRANEMELDDAAVIFQPRSRAIREAQQPQGLEHLNQTQRHGFNQGDIFGCRPDCFHAQFLA